MLTSVSPRRESRVPLREAELWDFMAAPSLLMDRVDTPSGLLLPPEPQFARLSTESWFLP